MARRHVEDSRHLALLGTVPDESAVAAPAEGQRQGIEKNGFAGAGLSREDGQAARQGEIQLFDQDDVTDREVYEHLSRHARRTVSPVARPGPVHHRRQAGARRC